MTTTALATDLASLLQSYFAPSSSSPALSNVLASPPPGAGSNFRETSPFNAFSRHFLLWPACARANSAPELGGVVLLDIDHALAIR